MCNTPDVFVEQAIGWIWEDLWKMLEQKHDEFRIIMAVDDLIHLDNMLRGGVGFRPDVVADFPIGL